MSWTDEDWDVYDRALKNATYTYDNDNVRYLENDNLILLLQKKIEELEQNEIKWIPVGPDTMPKDHHGRMLTVHWSVSTSDGRIFDEGDSIELGFWSTYYDSGNWFYYDKNRSKVEQNTPTIKRIVTYWAEQPKAPRRG